jgi:acyl dehydratase
MSTTDAVGSATDAAGRVTDAETYLARLKEFEGRSVGAPTEGPDAVNQAMIRHWVEAMGDENPVYLDEDAARAHGFPGVIAPPTMLQAWIMRGYKATAELAEARAAGRPASGSTPADDLMHLLDEGGFTSVVATNCEQEYVRPLVLGDRLSVASSIESVSPEKHTGLGIGHFITTLLAFTDQNGHPVASMRFRILKFRPGTGKSPAAAS